MSNNFPTFLQYMVSYCPRGHGYMALTDNFDHESRRCGRCRVAAWVDHEGRETERGKEERLWQESVKAAA